MWRERDKIYLLWISYFVRINCVSPSSSVYITHTLKCCWISKINICKVMQRHLNAEMDVRAFHRSTSVNPKKKRKKHSQIQFDFSVHSFGAMYAMERKRDGENCTKKMQLQEIINDFTCESFWINSYSFIKINRKEKFPSTICIVMHIQQR